MKRSNLLFGLILSGAAHFVLIVGLKLGPIFEVVTAPERQASTLMLTPPEPEAPLEDEAESMDTPAPPPPLPETEPEPPEPEPASEPTPVPQPVEQPPVPELDRVVASPKATETTRSGELSVGLEDAVVPPLRLEWGGVDDVRRIAGALRMRLLAVDQSRGVLGELSHRGALSLLDWNGAPPGYSNRVRVLSSAFFSGNLPRSQVDAISEVWLLVPTELDRRIVAAQLDSLEQAGLAVADVRYMRGGFVSSGGKFRFQIREVVER